MPRLSKEFGIKKGQVWVRRDWWKDREKKEKAIGT